MADDIKFEFMRFSIILLIHVKNKFVVTNLNVDTQILIWFHSCCVLMEIKHVDR